MKKIKIYDSQYDSTEQEKYWDFRSNDFTSPERSIEGPRERKLAMIHQFQEMNIINQDSEVLDLGCAVGLLAKELSPFVRHVVGIDISEKMLAHARRNNKTNRNVEFHKVNWLDADVRPYEKKFDLVIASMNPAICNTEMLNKMIFVSKGYCYLSHFVTRNSNIGDALDAYFGIKREFNRILNIIEDLWEQGMYPLVQYHDGENRKKIKFEEALYYYKKEYTISDDQMKEYTEFLSQFEKDGYIEKIVTYKQARLIWKVK